MNLSVNINISASQEVLSVLQGFASVLTKACLPNGETAPQAAVVQSPPIIQPPAQTAPVVPPTAPAQVPVAPQSAYTLEQISAAAAPLMDAGRMTELSGLLSSFGVVALTMLPPERYGEFATALRGLGAKI